LNKEKNKMQLLVEVKDNKAQAFMKVLRELSYVKTKTLSPAKAKFLSEFKEAIEELNQAKAGKLKVRNAEDFLKGLYCKIAPLI
jgi:hypothetical protein